MVSIRLTPPPPLVSNGQLSAYPPSPLRQQWSAFAIPPPPPPAADVICEQPLREYCFHTLPRGGMYWEIHSPEDRGVSARGSVLDIR